MTDHRPVDVVHLNEHVAQAMILTDPRWSHRPDTFTACVTMVSGPDGRQLAISLPGTIILGHTLGLAGLVINGVVVEPLVSVELGEITTLDALHNALHRRAVRAVTATRN